MDNEIFVKIEDYNEVLNIVKVVKEKINKANETISKINDLKEEEDAEVKTWTSNLETVSQKIADMEKHLSDSKQG